MSITSAINNLGRPIAFYPQLARFLGGIPEAVFTCQFLYWAGKKSGEVYKTAADIESETALTYEQQRRVIAKLKAAGYLEVERKGMPAKNYFRWNWGRLDADFEAWREPEIRQDQGEESANPRSRKTPDQDLGNPEIQILGNPRTRSGETPELDLGKSQNMMRGNPSTTSEITSETTSEITAETTTESAQQAARTRSAKTSKRRTAPTAREMTTDLPGLSHDVADDYIAHRKAKKAPLTTTAWRNICKEIAKTGAPPDDCLAEAMAAGWQGFRADWYLRRIQGAAPVRQKSIQDTVDEAQAQAQRVAGMLDTWGGTG